MIRLSRRTELIHPVRTMLFYGAQVIVYLAVVTALGWSWAQLRFSPLQRYYFGAYAQASVGVATGSGSDHVKWIEKRAPDRAWQIADPDDLIPASTGVAPFALSELARSQGWSELGYDSSGTYPEREIGNFLQADVFDGHSLPVLFCSPSRSSLARLVVLEVLRPLARARGPEAWRAMGPGVQAQHSFPGLAIVLSSGFV